MPVIAGLLVSALAALAIILPPIDMQRLQALGADPSRIYLALSAYVVGAGVCAVLCSALLGVWNVDTPAETLLSRAAVWALLGGLGGYILVNLDLRRPGGLLRRHLMGRRRKSRN